MDLLNRAYQKLDEINKDKNNNKLLLTRPVVMSQNKKTFIANFREIATKLNRKELELKLFFEEELRCITSIDGNGALVITGLYKKDGIEKVLKNYILQLVMCKQCKSYDTYVIKENRIQFIQCNKCMSKRAVE